MRLRCTVIAQVDTTLLVCETQKPRRSLSLGLYFCQRLALSRSLVRVDVERLPAVLIRPNASLRRAYAQGGPYLIALCCRSRATLIRLCRPIHVNVRMCVCVPTCVFVLKLRLPLVECAINAETRCLRTWGYRMNINRRPLCVRLPNLPPQQTSKNFFTPLFVAGDFIAWGPFSTRGWMSMASRFISKRKISMRNSSLKVIG